MHDGYQTLRCAVYVEDEGLIDREHRGESRDLSCYGADEYTCIGAIPAKAVSSEVAVSRKGTTFALGASFQARTSEPSALHHRKGRVDWSSARPSAASQRRTAREPAAIERPAARPRYGRVLKCSSVEISTG